MKVVLQVLSFYLALQSAYGSESILANASSGETAISVIAGAARKLSLRVEKNTLALNTENLPDGNALQPDQPLSVMAVDLSSARALTVTFGISDGRGRVRSVGVLLAEGGGTWKVASEWSVECGPLGELGFQREKQSFASAAPDTLTRQTKRTHVEGVVDKLDCGCLICGDRTTETIEDERFVWKPQTGTLERVSYEKRYVVQPGEGFLAIARKALGDARLLARIQRLNPDLKPASVLQPGQKILVAKE
ncbi:MAG TPA: LysM domain-containing protein [Planctomycetota bacterium]|nr:LysM domain-containing protein [Planctomycetota bacterium]